MKAISIRDPELKDTLFAGRENKNTGFDAPGIYWFNQDDFEIILHRCENAKINMSGIETRFEKDYEFDGCYLPEKDTTLDAKWYLPVFQNLINDGAERLYSATFVRVIYEPEDMQSCPCCQNPTIGELGSYEICRICNWEDDPVQSSRSELAGGANTFSLNDHRKQWFAKSQKK